MSFSRSEEIKDDDLIKNPSLRAYENRFKPVEAPLTWEQVIEYNYIAANAGEQMPEPEKIELKKLVSYFIQATSKATVLSELAQRVVTLKNNGKINLDQSTRDDNQKLVKVYDARANDFWSSIQEIADKRKTKPSFSP